MRWTGWILATSVLFAACGDTEPASEASEVKVRMSAESLFRGVFGCDPALIEQSAADSVVVSYPVFQEIFDTPAVRGREAVKEFSRGFCSRWLDPEITIHEAISEGHRVVLIWEFSASPAGAATDDPSRDTRESWGGISLFRLDGAGRVIEEIGEESTPGPIARTRR